MAVINEDMIRKVFDEMVKHRPALQKHLIADDEDDEVADYRVLGDLIIKNYPWPIGVELRRLFSASMRQLDRMRLDQIFKTIERTMQFTSFVMLSQLWKEKVKGNIEIPESFAKDFSGRFLVLSMGNFTWMIRAIGNIFNEKNTEWFIPEIKENFDKNFYNALDFWVPERNEIGHYQINLTQEEIEKRCVEYEEKLTFILQRISFFAKYKLVSVREIKVIKPKNQQAMFHHVIDLLNSSDSDFKAQELNEPNYAESRSVLLMKNIKSIEDYLNLSPLIIDTNSEILDNKEKFDIKKDIFLYTKFRSDLLMYVGTEVTEKCDLRTLSNYQILLAEFKDMMKTLTGVEVS
ncbi:MAG: hypothetical protein A2W91_02150 [Bacteroidetes bacterium GWF2_38_335]|nr:MAG: hypothetical protein A2W91_02150 [Bacteroidetes bacterium GWF2_38_335]OFY80654.1 MAG: hypothetical protein A2281_05165 [Bacteroidetes bacterium RIFOXYA12_FULL_38_20]HBS86996.1 hypothetical protein [Bacteroidales bacterium]